MRCTSDNHVDYGSSYSCHIIREQNFDFLTICFRAVFLKRQKITAKPCADLPDLMVLCLLFESRVRQRVNLHKAGFYGKKVNLAKTKLKFSIITRF